MHTCQICKQEYESYAGLSAHIRGHKITSREYYDLYVKKPGEGICVICSTPTRFRPGGYYAITCGKSCGMKYRLNMLKADPVKYSIMSEKKRKAKKQFWDNMTAEEREALCSKIAFTTGKQTNGFKSIDWEREGLRHLRIAGVVIDHSRSYNDQAQEIVDRNLVQIFGI